MSQPYAPYIDGGPLPALEAGDDFPSAPAEAALEVILPPRPCPYCGGAAEVVDETLCGLPLLSYVACVECGARGPTKSDSHTALEAYAQIFAAGRQPAANPTKPAKVAGCLPVKAAPPGAAPKEK